MEASLGDGGRHSRECQHTLRTSDIDSESGVAGNRRRASPLRTKDRASEDRLRGFETCMGLIWCRARCIERVRRWCSPSARREEARHVILPVRG